MVPLTSLWIPILLSAVIVFVASSILHMALPYHRNDLRRVPNEDEARQAIRALKIPPGDYAIPHAGSPEAMKDPAFLAKMSEGPVVFLTVVPPGPLSFGARLARWFVYSIVVSVTAAYVAGRAVGAGAEYLQAFRFAGCTAFLGYAMALPQHSIWYHRSWGTTIRSMIDGLIYGLLTGGTFGWLWPR